MTVLTKQADVVEPVSRKEVQTFGMRLDGMSDTHFFRPRPGMICRCELFPSHAISNHICKLWFK
jgi:hypothetical protein